MGYMTHLSVLGLWVALPTFFTDDYAIDLEAFTQHISSIHNHVDGFVIAGTTGEGILLTVAEMNHLIHVASVVTKKPIVVCLSLINYCDTVNFLHQIDQSRIQGLMILPGFYFSTTHENILDMLHTVTSLTKLPLIVYNNPKRTGIDLTPEIIDDIISQHGSKIVAIKECSGDIERISSLVSLCQLRNYSCSILTGDDTLFIESMQVGAAGIISVAGNLVPFLMKEFMLSQTIAPNILNTWNDLMKILYRFPNPQGVKLVVCTWLKKPVVFRAFLSKFHEKDRMALVDLVEKIRRIVESESVKGFSA